VIDWIFINNTITDKHLGKFLCLLRFRQLLLITVHGSLIADTLISITNIFDNDNVNTDNDNSVEKN